jgi:hypothetical protein
VRSDESETMVSAARLDAMAVCTMPFDPDALLQALG